MNMAMPSQPMMVLEVGDRDAKSIGHGDQQRSLERLGKETPAGRSAMTVRKPPRRPFCKELRRRDFVPTEVLAYVEFT